MGTRTSKWSYSGCRVQGLSACFLLVQKNGDVTSHSHGSGVEVMGNVKKKKKKLLLRLARILLPVLSDCGVSVGLPWDDVIWSVFSLDNNFGGQLSTQVFFFMVPEHAERPDTWLCYLGYEMKKGGLSAQRVELFSWSYNWSSNFKRWVLQRHL